MGLDPHQHAVVGEQLSLIPDQPLWIDLGCVVSIPLDPRPGLTNVVTVRRIDHVNYLDLHRRTLLTDTNTGLSLGSLPASLDDLLQNFEEDVFEHLRPFL